MKKKTRMKYMPRINIHVCSHFSARYKGPAYGPCICTIAHFIFMHPANTVSTTLKTWEYFQPIIRNTIHWPWIWFACHLSGFRWMNSEKESTYIFLMLNEAQNDLLIKHSFHFYSRIWTRPNIIIKKIIKINTCKLMRDWSVRVFVFST